MFFADRLLAAIDERQTPCIVGIDPVYEKIPGQFLQEHELADAAEPERRAAAIARYSAEIIEAVADLVPAIKPQSAFYERYGAAGIRALEDTVRLARRKNLLVLLDVKRGDIGSTAEAYAAAYLGSSADAPMAVDAVTLNPYLGEDSLEPFFEAAEANGRGVFVLVKTSNAGGADVQDLDVGDRTVCDVVAGILARRCARHVGARGYGEIGAVVGATFPETAARLRAAMPHSIFLVPGIGHQGGDTAALKAFFDREGRGAVVPSSRIINYPPDATRSPSPRAAIREAAVAFVREVRRHLAA